MLHYEHQTLHMWYVSKLIAIYAISILKNLPNRSGNREYYFAGNGTKAVCGANGHWNYVFTTVCKQEIILAILYKLSVHGVYNNMGNLVLFSLLIPVLSSCIN